jgi:hypothetical protein
MAPNPDCPLGPANKRFDYFLSGTTYCHGFAKYNIPYFETILSNRFNHLFEIGAELPIAIAIIVDQKIGDLIGA